MTSRGLRVIDVSLGSRQVMVLGMWPGFADSTPGERAVGRGTGGAWPFDRLRDPCTGDPSSRCARSGTGRSFAGRLAVRPGIGEWGGARDRLRDPCVGVPSSRRARSGTGQWVSAALAQGPGDRWPVVLLCALRRWGRRVDLRQAQGSTGGRPFVSLRSLRDRAMGGRCARSGSGDEA